MCSSDLTGALMAMSKVALRTMPGIDRPALAGLMPTLEEHDVVMLDLGANTECDARNLVQFAIMGAAYAHIVTGTEKPRVRLLNIGTEETKGTGELQEAAQRLRAATATALATPAAVALPWLFTTTPLRPRKTAPLWLLGSRWWRSSSVAGRDTRKPIFERSELRKAFLSKSVTNRAEPSIAFSAMFPENPSATTTSTLPRLILSAST